MQSAILSHGNKKLGKDTLIYNISSATDCASKKLGLCKLPCKCYAMKAERQYPAVLPFRRRQAKAWAQLKARQLAAHILEQAARKRVKIQYLRFNEAGDFRNQADVDKLCELARLLPSLTVYGYTARKDLDFSKRPANLVINGSGFMIDNSFTAVKEARGTVCGNSCKTCSLCKVKGKRRIQVSYH